jgi:NAD(P)-dependent dehydrogenase (short-subunit alcohol dehydrogenase family)
MEKVILITGASSGIGKETAKLFQSKNWKVAATMRNPDAAEDLQRIADIECFRLDVTDPESIRIGLAEAISRFGRVDVVVNNAGYGLMGAFEAASDEQVRNQFETNVFGLMNVCRVILPHFREHRKGMIVNVTSVSGLMAFPMLSLYHASKWAVEGFSESIQYELEPLNIRVKIIEPGPIKTDFYDRSADMVKADEMPEYSSMMETALTNMGKAGETAPDGSVVAQTIYEAVTDGTRKLRYRVNTKGILTMRRLLPEFLFFRLIKNIILK